MNGRLKIFLGYSSGVGKSYRMLDEGRRRLERGQDVVVGAAQPMTLGAAGELLQLLPRLAPGPDGGLDLDALLRRHPGVCLVDGLAHDNPPSAKRPHRWQELNVLLAAGIHVLTTVNLQFIAERQAEVEALTGKRPPVSVPERVLMQADEIEVVDAPASGGRSVAQREALREMALLLAADVVDHQLERYLQEHGIAASWGTQERILLCLTPRVQAARMIASGARNADRFRGELLAAHVQNRGLRRRDRERLEANLESARAAGAEIVLLAGRDPAAALLAFARERRVTQLFVGHSLHTRWWQRLRRSSLARLVRDAEGMDVRVFPQ